MVTAASAGNSSAKKGQRGCQAASDESALWAWISVKDERVWILLPVSTTHPESSELEVLAQLQNIFTQMVQPTAGYTRILD